MCRLVRKNSSRDFKAVAKTCTEKKAVIVKRNLLLCPGTIGNNPPKPDPFHQSSHLTQCKCIWKSGLRTQRKEFPAENHQLGRYVLLVSQEAHRACCSWGTSRPGSLGNSNRTWQCCPMVLVDCWY